MTTPMLQYVARFDGGGRGCWVWRGRLQGELAMVLPVCQIPVSFCGFYMQWHRTNRLQGGIARLCTI